MPGKNNQWEDVDNQGVRWEEKNGAKVSEQINFQNKASQYEY